MRGGGRGGGGGLLLEKRDYMCVFSACSLSKYLGPALFCIPV